MQIMSDIIKKKMWQVILHISQFHETYDMLFVRRKKEVRQRRERKGKRKRNGGAHVKQTAYIFVQRC